MAWFGRLITLSKRFFRLGNLPLYLIIFVPAGAIAIWIETGDQWALAAAIAVPLALAPGALLADFSDDEEEEDDDGGGGGGGPGGPEDLPPNTDPDWDEFDEARKDWERAKVPG